MSEQGYPPVAELLPHTGNMILLSKVLDHEEDETHCAVEVDEQELFRDVAGDVPAWVGLEFLAQCIAAHAGLIGREAGASPKLGFLLGSRRLRFHTARFGRGSSLLVKVTRVWGGSSGMVAFDCSIEDRQTGERLVDGRLTCMTPDREPREDVLK